MRQAFLDTNILLLHLCNDHPELSQKASAILRSVEQGLLRAHILDTVIFEAVFTLERHYRHSKVAIRETLLPLIELPGIVLPGKRRYRQVFALYVERNLPFADAYYAALKERL
ncbi:MAG TPA: PIN domain-containing protein [Nitrolancea sp.]|nr:PIN domain-containing protein [Nitrolancea sp.]